MTSLTLITLLCIYVCVHHMCVGVCAHLCGYIQAPVCLCVYMCVVCVCVHVCMSIVKI